MRPAFLFLTTTPRSKATRSTLLGLVVALATLTLSADLAAQGRRSRRASEEKDHSSIREAFRPIVAAARASTVQIFSGDETLAFGLVLDASGALISKASELKGTLRGVYGDAQESALTVVAVDILTDLALLAPRDALSPLPAIQWAETTPAVGSLLATVGLDEDPIAIGVVSVAPRSLKERGILGIQFDDSGSSPRIARVYPNTGASRAGVENGDLVTRIAGIEVESIEAVVEVLGQSSPGETLELALRREDRELTIEVTLGRQPNRGEDERTLALSGSLSERRWNFPLVLQHDTFLLPRQCGSAIVDLDGRVVGLNIARAGRVDTFALPVEVVLASAERLRSGELAPGVELLVTLDSEAIEERVRALEKRKSDAAQVLEDARSALELAREKLDALQGELDRLRGEIDRRRRASEPPRARI